MEQYLTLLDGISQAYGQKTILNDISLKIKKNKIHALLGPNGAGKTTLFKILTNLIQANKGKVLTEKLEIGLMPEQVALYQDMTVYEYLLFCYRIATKKKEIEKRKIDDYLSLLKMGPYRNTFIAKLSKGYKQKVALIASLINDPDLLVLDEPLNGLDPIAVKELRDLFIELKSKMTIIYSSHLLSEVEQICDDVTLIQDGVIIESISLDELKENISQKIIINIDFKKGQHPPEELKTWGLVEWSVTEGNARFELEDDKLTTDLFFQLAKSKIEVSHFSKDRNSLEKYFLSSLSYE